MYFVFITLKKSKIYGDISQQAIGPNVERCLLLLVLQSMLIAFNNAVSQKADVIEFHYR